jgi:hypothetical protein
MRALGADVGGWLGYAFVAGHACSFADRAEAANLFGLCRTGLLDLVYLVNCHRNSSSKSAIRGITLLLGPEMIMSSPAVAMQISTKFHRRQRAARGTQHSRRADGAQ